MATEAAREFQGAAERVALWGELWHAPSRPTRCVQVDNAMSGCGTAVGSRGGRMGRPMHWVWLLFDMSPGVGEEGVR